MTLLSPHYCCSTPYTGHKQVECWCTPVISHVPSVTHGTFLNINLQPRIHQDTVTWAFLCQCSWAGNCRARGRSSHSQTAPLALDLCWFGHNFLQTHPSTASNEWMTQWHRPKHPSNWSNPINKHYSKYVLGQVWMWEHFSDIIFQPKRSHDVTICLAETKQS